jgi:hypothetical protein
MQPTDQPKKETVAATDEFFKDQPVRPEEWPARDDSATPRTGYEAASARKPQDSPPLQDYVRELQQEFEEQEEEGKL